MSILISLQGRTTPLLFRDMNTDTQPKLQWMLAVSFVQGLVLFALNRTVENEVWPATSPTAFLPIAYIAILGPLTFLLSWTPDNQTRLITRTAGFLLVLAIMAAYTGWNLSPAHGLLDAPLILILALSGVVAAFIATAYIQWHANQEQLTYRLLFERSWRNFLTAALSIAFTGGVALVLVIWAQLFKVVGISFFEDLFSEDWFLLPVLTMSFGGAASIFRNLTRVMDGLTAILEGLIRVLLPLICLVAVIFIATLPFVGLTPLWDTGNGTFLLLWLTALTLFFTNAVYQSTDERPSYPSPVAILVAAGLLTLPIYSALSFYGLWTRIDTYGFTVERAWGMVVWAILAAFSVGYAAGVVARRLEWPQVLARTNMIMAWVVLGIAVLANTPILDFRKISLASQIDRVTRGEISWTQFDFYYSHWNLGRPGYEFAERLRQEHSDDEALLALINDPPRRIESRPELTGDLFARIQFHGEPFDIPEAVKAAYRDLGWENDEQQAVAIRADVTRDGVAEIVLIVFIGDYVHHAFVAVQHESGWRLDQWAASPSYLDGLGEELLDNVTVTPPIYDDVTVGDILLRKLD